jgi:SAM-dependent methyltransferase
VREFLETYSGIPQDEQSAHVHQIVSVATYLPTCLPTYCTRLTNTYLQRDRAWALRSYPCTGLGVWLLPYISRSPALPQILSTLHSSGTFLDIGCHLGCDLRYLAYRGAPSSRLYGVDIVSHEDISYDLFKDKQSIGSRPAYEGTFIEADFLSHENKTLEDLCGKVDVLSVSAVLHQWDWNAQRDAALRLVQFLKQGEAGVGGMVVGYQIGNRVAGEDQFPPGKGPKQWRHDVASWNKFWEEIGREIGVKWKVEARLKAWEDMGWDPKDTKFMLAEDMVLDWVVTRVE